MQSNYCLELGRVPTTKAVGFKYITKVGTDGFSRRTINKRDFLTFGKMSIYDELPVFKASYDLLLNIFQFTANFKREYKYTVGEKLKNETLALIVLVYRANSSKEKVEIIQQAREQIELIRLLIRVLKDLCCRLSQQGKHYKTYKARRKMIFKHLSGWWWNYVFLSGGIGKFVLKMKMCYG